ncbi:MAG: DUF4270 family protein [Saprospiraceae bacterium]|nr:DUF4270 family protein [Lewinella sp.]
MNLIPDYVKKWIVQLSVGITLIVSACTDPSFVGTDLFTDESFELEVIDTVSLRVSTILIDSIDTYKPDRLLLGFHRDKLLGKALAAPFFEVGLDTWNNGRPEKSTTAFDSLTLVLTYDGYSAFDTSLWQTISVHRLREDMEVIDDYSLYNNSSFSYREISLGTLRFRPRPGSEGEIEIRLSDQLGLDLFEKIRDADAIMESDAEFRSYFKGLVVLPDTTQNAAVLGFATTPQLRLYYRDLTDLTADPLTITFSCDPSGEDILFNRIQGDRSGTLLSPLASGQYTQLNSRNSGNLAGLQGGTGLQARIDLPYIRSLLESSPDALIADAQLKIRPVLDDASEQFELPQTLEVYWVDEDNAATAQNTYPAYLYTDPEFGRDIYYLIDIRDFVELQFKSAENTDMGLLLTFREEAYDVSMDKIKMGNDQHASAPMELLITLLSLK